MYHRYRFPSVWREMGRLVEWPAPRPLQKDASFPAMNVWANEEGQILTAEVPGISPEELEVTYTDHVLTIKGEIKEDKEVDEGQYHLRERHYGAFSRSLSLPVPVDEDGIRATYEAGVLTLHLPKTEEARPKRIPVKASHMIIEG